MIEFTSKARDVITNAGINELFIDLKYTKGPCSDNLCKMIPKVVVSLERAPNASYILLESAFVKVYAVPPIAKTISKYKDRVMIKTSSLGSKLQVTGITYAF